LKILAANESIIIVIIIDLSHAQQTGTTFVVDGKMDQSSIAVIIAVVAILATIYLSVTPAPGESSSNVQQQGSASSTSSPTKNDRSKRQSGSDSKKHNTKNTKESASEGEDANIIDEKPNQKSAKYSGGNWKADESESLKSLLAATRSGCDIPVVNTDDMEHIYKLVDENIPFMVRGFANDWKAKSTWTKQTLLKNYGNRVIKQDSETSIVHNSGGVSQAITLEKYLDQLEGMQGHQGTQSDLFVFDTEILNAIPELRQDVIIPSFVESWDNLERESNKSMWHMLSIGPSRSGLPLHSHGKTWISLVYGAKKWFLYPPGYNLPDSFGQECHALCTVSQWIQSIYPRMLSLPQVFDVSSTATAKQFGTSNRDPRDNASLDDWSNVFREIYSFNRSANEGFKPMECLQQAGDLVYLPDQWLHLTFNSGETVGYGGQSALMAKER
jgi:hypothetical protein